MESLNPINLHGMAADERIWLPQSTEQGPYYHHMTLLPYVLAPCYRVGCANRKTLTLIPHVVLVEI